MIFHWRIFKTLAILFLAHLLFTRSVILYDDLTSTYGVAAMKTYIPYVLCAFWTVALIASGLCGYYANEIFNGEKAGCKLNAKGFHQFWLNFVGSFVGWAALWVLVQKYHGCIFQGCSIHHFSWYIFVALIAFVGITGYLPMMIIPPLATLTKAIDNVAIVITKWFAK